MQTLNIEFQMSTQNLSINTLIYAFSLRMRLDYHSIVDVSCVLKLFSIRSIWVFQTELFLTDTIQLTSPIAQIQTIARLSMDQSNPFFTKEHIRIIDRRRQDVEHYQIHSVLKRITGAPIALKMERFLIKK